MDFQRMPARDTGFRDEGFLREMPGGSSFKDEGFLQMPRGMLSDTSPMQRERDALQARERQYYTDHPQSSLNLTPTEWTTQYGMPVYTDQHGEHHSESSRTFKIPNGKWTTAPMIWPDPNTGDGRYFNIDEVVGILGANGWNNPITGEKIPMFDSEPEATSWALDRDMTLQDKNLPFNR